MAANIFTGATDSNWGTATNWSLGTVPTASDGHVATFNAASPNCTVDSIPRVCNHIDFTGYVNIITMSNTVTISGNITFISTMSSRVTGSSGLQVNANSVITSNGGTWNNSLTILAGYTLTLSDNLIITGNWFSTSPVTSNGFTIYIGGNFYTNSTMLGTSTIVLNGTGTWSGGGNNFKSITINTSGTITLSGTISLTQGSLTYVAGTVVSSGCTLIISDDYTINTNSIIWTNLTLNQSATRTLTVSSVLKCVNLIIGSVNNQRINGSNVEVSGNLTINGSGFGVIGSSSIVLTGTGTWSGAGTLSIGLIINTAGTITISGTVKFGVSFFPGCVLTYTAGTVITTGSTLQIGADCTLNTNGINWNNITITTGTVTLNSLLTSNGTLSVGSAGTVTFNGTNGFTSNTFSCITAGRTINFATGKTYVVTNNLIVTGTAGSKVSFVSTSTGALFNLQAGATQSVQNCNATRINSSGGQTIYTSAGTLTSTINWLISAKNGFLAFFMS